MVDMWIPIMLLAWFLIFLVNPMLSLMLSIPVIALLIAYKLAYKGKLSFPGFNDVKTSKYFREFLFTNLDLNDFREVDLKFKFKVSDKLLLVSSSMGFTYIFGALLFRNVRDLTLLRNILLGVPFNYHLIFRGGEGSSESYILLLYVKVGFHALGSAMSKLIEILNSLSLSIPADSVVVLSGDEVISQVFPVVQGVI